MPALRKISDVLALVFSLCFKFVTLFKKNIGDTSVKIVTSFMSYLINISIID
jgi:hypothetical protein